MTTKEIPSLTTARLILRACTMADAADMQRLAGDRDIAATTLRIPHPYGLVLAWPSPCVPMAHRMERIWAASG